MGEKIAIVNKDTGDEILLTVTKIKAQSEKVTIGIQASQTYRIHRDEIPREEVEAGRRLVEGFVPRPTLQRGDAETSP